MENVKKPYVVLGEASESESEEELNLSEKTSSLISGSNVILGEAPESDDETAKAQSVASVSTAISACSLTDLGVAENRKITSLLGKKLYERNKYLHKDINNYFENTIENAKELNTVDQQLLKCQMKLQNVVDIVDTLEKNINQLDTKLKALLASAYLSEMKMN